MRFYGAKVESCRNFANKIWNASRFVLMNIGDEPVLPIEAIQPDIADRWILARLNAAIREVTENLEAFELSLASQKVYDFIWSEFCDWYIEMAKPRLYGEDETARQCARSVLLYVLKDTLKLLHPFMPFVTEEIYGFLPGGLGYIMLSSWPVANPAFDFARDEAAMSDVMELITSIRNVRAELNVPRQRKRASRSPPPPKSRACSGRPKNTSSAWPTRNRWPSKPAGKAWRATLFRRYPRRERLICPLPNFWILKRSWPGWKKKRPAPWPRSAGQNPSWKTRLYRQGPKKVIDDVRAALSRNEALLKKLEERMEMLSK